MATKQMKKNELKFEDFEPVSELQELPEKFTLIVNLPGKQGYLIHIVRSCIFFNMVHKLSVLYVSFDNLMYNLFIVQSIVMFDLYDGTK